MNEATLETDREKVFAYFARSSSFCARIFPMDAIDRKILAELQRDGRLTITELAERVQLSVSPCDRRLRDLERIGVITGYHATLSPEALGLGFETLVFVTMREANR